MTGNNVLATPHFNALLTQCMHCGLCLPACPTYAVFGTEMAAPRGRIQLMRAVAEGRVALDDAALRRHLSLCLACRACEPACPSGVRYGELVETARVAMERARKPSLVARALRRVALHEILAHPARLRALARVLRAYQALGLPRLVRALSFLLPRPLRAMESILPPLPARYPDYRTSAPASGAQRGEVLFLHGCIQDAFLAEVNAATVRVLQRNGFAVHFPRAQTCCGAAMLHIGGEELAREMARRNIDACLIAHPRLPLLFAEQERGLGSEFPILNNAGGCGATLKEYARLLRDDAQYAERAAQFSARVRDVNEFLAENLRVPPRGELKVRATYQDSCHLRNAQKVVSQPRALLQQIPGIELVEMKQPDRCCGSAGVYNIAQAETAEMILDAKMADIAATGAEVIVTTNTGCHLQLLAGVRRAGLNARVAHVVELLDKSYEIC